MIRDTRLTLQRETSSLLRLLPSSDIKFDHLSGTAQPKSSGSWIYTDLARLTDGGMMQVWLGSAEEKENYLWCGLYYPEYSGITLAIERAQKAGEAPKHIIDYTKRADIDFGVVDAATFVELYRTGELYEGFYLGRYFPDYVSTTALEYFSVITATSREQTSPEVEAAIEAAENLASPQVYKSVGQGFGLAYPQRLVIELYAMKLAEEWLIKLGYTCKDVHANHSYDYIACKEGKNVIVEVKGTTGGLSTILLTNKEVSIHKALYPENILIVVYNIALSDDGSSASGGTIMALQPWKIDDSAITPISLQYRLIRK